MEGLGKVDDVDDCDFDYVFLSPIWKDDDVVTITITIIIYSDDDDVAGDYDLFLSPIWKDVFSLVDHLDGLVKGLICIMIIS